MTKEKRFELLKAGNLGKVRWGKPMKNEDILVRFVWADPFEC